MILNFNKICLVLIFVIGAIAYKIVFTVILAKPDNLRKYKKMSKFFQIFQDPKLYTDISFIMKDNFFIKIK